MMGRRGYVCLITQQTGTGQYFFPEQIAQRPVIRAAGAGRGGCRTANFLSPSTEGGVRGAGSSRTTPGRWPRRIGPHGARLEAGRSALRMGRGKASATANVTRWKPGAGKLRGGVKEAGKINSRSGLNKLSCGGWITCQRVFRHDGDFQRRTPVFQVFDVGVRCGARCRRGSSPLRAGRALAPGP